MGWVGLEPTVYNLWLKARSVRRYGNHPKWYREILSFRGSWWSLDHPFNLPPFGPLWVIGGHLRNCHNQQKRGGTFWFPPPFLFLFERLLVFPKNRRGLIRNMSAKIPIRHIAECWICVLGVCERTGHCYFTSMFYLYNFFFKKS